MTWILCKLGLHLRIRARVTVDHVRWPMEMLCSTSLSSYDLEAFEERVRPEQAQAVKVTEVESCVCGRSRARGVYYES